MKYPKIQTLYDRDEKTFKVNPGRPRCPEFSLVKRWLITEKIDGTNIRIFLEPDGSIRFGGRTDQAQLPTHLLAHLQDTFTLDRVKGAITCDDDGLFPPTILYGEGYGEKIQKGGKYRKGVSFRLFDVRIGEWWINWYDVEQIAQDLGICTVPRLGLCAALPQIQGDLASITGYSAVAQIEGGDGNRLPEGVVARTEPLLFTRRGDRVMWKLKFKDFLP